MCPFSGPFASTFKLLTQFLQPLLAPQRLFKIITMVPMNNIYSLPYHWMIILEEPLGNLDSGYVSCG